MLVFHPFRVEQYSITGIIHVCLCVQQLNKHSGCLKFVITRNHANVNIYVQVSVCLDVFVSFGCVSGREIAGRVEAVFKLQGTARLFSRDTTLFSSSVHSV